MNVNRRNFFGVAAVTPLTAKDVAKKIVEDAQNHASGVSYYSDSLYTGISTPTPSPSTRPLWEAIKDIGMPEWKRDDLYEDAKRSRTLDPDLAAMKSVSLQMKMQMQWQRNYERLVQRAHKQTDMARRKRMFFETNPDITEY